MLNKHSFEECWQMRKEAFERLGYGTIKSKDCAPTKRKWWTNGTVSMRSIESPGAGWQKEVTNCNNFTTSPQGEL